MGELCDSVRVENLAPGQTLDLSALARQRYATVPPGPYTILAWAAGPDHVAETDETDNHILLRNVTIPAQ